MSTIADAAEPGAGSLSRVIFSRERIARRVEEMGRSITEFYRNSALEPDGADGTPPSTGAGGPSVLVLGVLKGSFVFLADLVRSVELPLHVDFLVAESYGSSTASRGDVELLYEPQMSVQGRAVLLVEDILDSGNTLEAVVPRLEAGNPRSLDLCVLLRKNRVEGAPEPRWVGFEAPDEFLVGYGLDYSENYRHLPYIASLQEPRNSKQQ